MMGELSALQDKLETDAASCAHSHVDRAELCLGCVQEYLAQVRQEAIDDVCLWIHDGYPDLANWIRARAAEEKPRRPGR